MMDVKIAQDTFGVYDVEVADGDVAGVEGFDTSIFIALGTDARAPVEKVSRPELRRGWMGDLVSDHVLGSLLWLVEQRRLTQGTLNEVVDYARQALAYFVSETIAKSITVEGSITPQVGISLTIVITAPDGSEVTRYLPLWRVTGAV